MGGVLFPRRLKLAHKFNSWEENWYMLKYKRENRINKVGQTGKKKWRVRLEDWIWLRKMKKPMANEIKTCGQVGVLVKYTIALT